MICRGVAEGSGGPGCCQCHSLLLIDLWHLRAEYLLGSLVLPDKWARAQVGQVSHMVKESSCYLFFLPFPGMSCLPREDCHPDLSGSWFMVSPTLDRTGM